MMQICQLFWWGLAAIATGGSDKQVMRNTTRTMSLHPYPGWSVRPLHARRFLLLNQSFTQSGTVASRQQKVTASLRRDVACHPDYSLESQA